MHRVIHCYVIFVIQGIKNKQLKISVGRSFLNDCKNVTLVKAKFYEKELEKIDFTKIVACSGIDLELQNTIHFSK